LTFTQDSAPAQYATPFNAVGVPQPQLDLTGAGQPMAVLYQLLDGDGAGQVQPRDYVPLTAQQTPAALNGLWYRPARDLRERTPSAVLAWLPQPLSQPQAAVSLLDALSQAARLPFENGALWAERLLRAALPSAPSLPPRDINALRDEWFPNDVFGLVAATRLDALVPRSPTLPEYPIGGSSAWLLP
jgi:hypothetical protein